MIFRRVDFDKRVSLLSCLMCVTVAGGPGQLFTLARRRGHSDSYIHPKLPAVTRPPARAGHRRSGVRRNGNISQLQYSIEVLQCSNIQLKNGNIAQLQYLIEVLQCSNIQLKNGSVTILDEIFKLSRPLDEVGQGEGRQYLA